MINWTKYPSTRKDSPFVESTDAQELRGRRVWRFVIVLWLTWVFFAGFLWYRGFMPATCICLGETLLLFLTMFAYRRHGDFRWIMNLCLAASAVGLLAVSVSHPAMAMTMLFYPVSILVASQLLGVRAAFSWFIINLIAFCAFSFSMYGFYETLATSRFDELVLLMGVAGCVYFCCQQGEVYYRQRTQSLIELSEDLQAKSNRLEELATTDSLTGLTNRFRFQQLLKESVQQAVTGSQRMALFLIDMDGFKEINDTLGHPIGDEVLVEIASRLLKEFGHRANVSRLGGDEFCVIYPDIGSEAEADTIGSEICRMLSHRYVLDDAEFPLGASVGFALCPDHATTDAELLAYADTAMFHAKEQQIGQTCYVRAMTDRLVEYRKVQDELSNALEREEFFLVYQPQVDMRSGRVIGVESLVRWKHNGEIIPPFRFIHLLEKSRGIIAVSAWIIREACRQLSIWDAAGYGVNVSINISAIQFADPDFYKSIIGPIQEFGVNPKYLDFEITEGLLIDNVEETVVKLNQIRALGANISIDDFGTGYSSLAYLRQFPINTLKIDRAFIKDFPSSDDGVIASSIIVLAKSLGLQVIAEGVETKEQLDFLMSHDCDQYQGFYLSPPVTADKVVAFFSLPATELLQPTRS